MSDAKKEDEKDSNGFPIHCPKCGAVTVFGYGLAGGGIGPYVHCETEGCDFFAKQQDKEDRK